MTRQDDTWIREFVLKEGVVDGERTDVERLAEKVGLPIRAVLRKLRRVEDDLLKKYGLERSEVSLQLICSLEGVKRAQGDLEVWLARLRKCDEKGEMGSAIGMQSRLARQRDALLLKLQSEERKEKKTGKVLPIEIHIASA